MKKLILLIIPLLIASCAPLKHGRSRAIVPVNVGTVANDGTGDPIRTAFQKINASFVTVTDTTTALRTSVNLKTTSATTDTKIQYYHDTTLTNAYDIGPVIADLQANIAGGASAATARKDLIFTIGDTNSPDPGDSTLTHSNFIGRNVDLFRPGGLSQRHFTATNTTEGWRFDNATGTITVNPPFQTNEEITVWVTEPMNVTYLSLEPTGGGGTSRIDSPGAYWPFDEVSGTQSADQIGTNNLTATGATLGVTGKYGKAISFNGSSYTVGSNTGLEYDSLTIAFWWKTSDASATNEQIIGKSDYGPAKGFRVGQSSGHLNFTLQNSVSGYAYMTSDAAINDGNWHFIICTHDGANLRIYIDGSIDANSPYAWAHFPDYTAGATSFYVGNRIYGDQGAVGVLDELRIYHLVLSATEVSQLYSRGY